jgi:cell division initiation protein
MSLTPVEIRHVRLGRGLGYKREAVDRLLSDVVESFEAVWRGRADLADRVEALDHDLARYREMETVLRSTLVSAESAAADMRERARREAQVVLDEARSEARSIAREAEREHASLLQEARRIRALLGAALSTVTDATGSDRVDARADAPARAVGLEDTAEHALAQAERSGSGSRAA